MNLRQRQRSSIVLHAHTVDFDEPSHKTSHASLCHTRSGRQPISHHSYRKSLFLRFNNQTNSIAPATAKSCKTHTLARTTTHTHTHTTHTHTHTHTHRSSWEMEGLNSDGERLASEEYIQELSDEAAAGTARAFDLATPGGRRRAWFRNYRGTYNDVPD